MTGTNQDQERQTNLSSSAQYERWVKARDGESIENFFSKPFLPPDLGKDNNMDTILRYSLYTSCGMNVLLDGATGTGKTTLVEWVTQQRGMRLHDMIVDNKYTLAEAKGEAIQQTDETIVYTPGPITRFVIYGGVLFIDEIPNINHRLGRGIHGLLQFKKWKVDNTHYGLFEKAPEHGKHMIVAAGNFSYVSPNFDRATLQRWTVIPIPSLPKFGDYTGALSFEGYDSIIQTLYPWKFSSEHPHPTEIDRRWMDVIDKPHERNEALEEMLYSIKTLVTTFEGFPRPLDMSDATAIRVVSLYSPYISEKNFQDILAENIINPITLEYPGIPDKKEKLTKDIFLILADYAPLLFSSSEPKPSSFSNKEVLKALAPY